MKKLSVFAFIVLGITSVVCAQFPPPAGQSGTTAIYKDSLIISGWATGCVISRGWLDISNPGLGYATTGDSSMAIGMAGTNGIISLGDGGMATLSFDSPVKDNEGWDFAVFENSFDDLFLELAFVEVSSDGINFFRFSSTSLTDTNVQVAPFGQLDASKINNLAGKYRANYGTPFDLNELDSVPGLDISNITHIRVIDVVGSVNDTFASRDAFGNKINDPWPTPFPPCGFDLDAVAVIETNAGIIDADRRSDIILSVWPVPARDHLSVSFVSGSNCKGSLIISDAIGVKRLVIDKFVNYGTNTWEIDVRDLPKGFYLLLLCIDNENYVSKVILAE